MAGVYIHIPYCRKLCSYCDFYHIISSGDNSSSIDAMLKEIELRKDYLNNETVNTIYIGGGTPSLLSVTEIETLLNQVYKQYSVENGCETTIELNPDDVDPDYLAGLKRLNINRISLGIQSWRDTDLKILKSLKGPNGGFSMLKDPNTVTLYDVVVAIDGEDTFTNCVIHNGTCRCIDRTKKPCTIHDDYAKTRSELIYLFKNKTIYDLVQKAGNSGLITI